MHRYRKEYVLIDGILHSIINPTNGAYPSGAKAHSMDLGKGRTKSVMVMRHYNM